MAALRDWLVRHSFRLRLVGAAVLSEILFIAILTYLVVQQLDNTLTSQIRARVEQNTALFNIALGTELVERDYTNLELALQNARSEGEIEYALLRDARGQIIVAAGWEAQVPPPSADLDIAGAAERGIIHLHQFIQLSGRIVGELHYGLSTAFLQEARTRLLRQAAVVASVGVLLSLGVMLVLGFGLMRRLGRLTDVARQFAEGNLKARVSDSRRDELGELATDFDHMAQALGDRIRDLHASEERLALVMRGTSDGIWDHDVLNNSSYFSPRFMELLGYEDEQEFRLLFHFRTALHPDDREGTLAAYDSALRKRMRFDETYRLRCRDGSYRWFRGRGQAVWDDSGRPVRFSGAVTDIMTQKLAEGSVRSLLAEQQAILDNALIGIWLVRDRTVVRCNRRCEDLLGYGRGELAGMPVRAVYVSDDIYHDRGQRIYEALGRGESYEEAMELVRKDGSRFWCAITGRAIDPARPQEGSIWIFYDITMQRRALSALQEEKAFTDALLDSLPGLFTLVDENLRILRWNRNLERLSGFGEAQIRLMRTDELYIEREVVAAACRAAFRRNIPVHGEAMLKTADGRLVPYYLNGIPVLLGGQRMLVGMGFDISARKEVEAALLGSEERFRKLNEELEQRVRERTAELTAANKELEAFSYSVSHDLVAPLRAIDGFSRMIEEDYGEQVDARGKGYIDRIRKGTQRMQQLIDDMLALSRVTRDEMKREPVDLSGLAEQILADLKLAQPQRRVVTQISTGMRVIADANLIRIALDNLLRNAWKFTARHATANISFGVLREGDERVYFVRDDGAGFDMQYAGKLFGAFQRMHRLQEFEGTGIGLAIVHRIIQRHGGRIWAEAAPGQGATFFFTLS